MHTVEKTVNTNILYNLPLHSRKLQQNFNPESWESCPELPRLMARNKLVHVYNLGTRIGSAVSLTREEVDRWTSRAQKNDILVRFTL